MNIKFKILGWVKDSRDAFHLNRDIIILGGEDSGWNSCPGAQFGAYYLRMPL